MSKQPANIQRQIATFQPQAATRSMMLETPTAVVLMDFFGVTVTEQREAIGAAVSTLLDGEQTNTLDNLKKIVEEANKLVYQARPAGTNQGGSIALIAVANDEPAVGERIKVRLATYGSYRLWQLRLDKTTKQLDQRRGISYLGSYHLNQHDLSTDLVDLHAGEQIFVTTDKVGADTIAGYADKTFDQVHKEIAHGDEKIALVFQWQGDGHRVKKRGLITHSEVRQSTTAKSVGQVIGIALAMICLVLVSIAIRSGLTGGSIPELTSIPATTVTDPLMYTPTPPGQTQQTKMERGAASVIAEAPGAQQSPSPPIVLAPTAILKALVMPTPTPVPVVAAIAVPTTEIATPLATLTEESATTGTTTATLTATIQYDIPEIILSTEAYSIKEEGELTFKWFWSGQLTDDQAFQILIKKNEDPEFSVLSTPKNSELTIDENSYSWNIKINREYGTYKWTVALVRQGIRSPTATPQDFSITDKKKEESVTCGTIPVSGCIPPS